MKRPGSQYKYVKRIFFSIPAALIIATLVVIVGMAAWDMKETYQSTQETVDRLKQEKQELSARLQAAQSAAAEISTDRGLREEIRNKFSVAKPGERVIVLNKNNRQTATTTKTKRPGFWERFKEIVWPFG